MREMTDVEAAYLAGMFDGEGCISINFRSPNSIMREVNTQLSIQVKIAMTHKETIDYIESITGCGRVSYIRKKNPNHKDQWLWAPQLRDAREIIERCHPYMVTKRRNAEIFMELMDIRKKSTRNDRNWERQFDLTTENISLNRRGRV